MSAIKQNREEINENTPPNHKIIRRDSEDSIASKTSLTNALPAVSQSSTPVSLSCPTTGTSTPVRSLPIKVQQQLHLVDGVWLSDRGLSQIKSILLEQPKRTRVKRGTRQALNQTSNASKTEETDEVSKEDDTGSLEDNKVAEDGTAIKTDEVGEKKKRQRRLHKLGIGGFSVKQRGRMSTSKEEEVVNSNADIDMNGTEVNADIVSNDKPRRRRRVSKKKNQLQDSFPVYMQEAFFGKILMDSSQNEGNTTFASNSINNVSDDEEFLNRSIGKDKIIDLTPTEIAAVKLQKPKVEPLTRVLDETSRSSLDVDLQDGEALEDLLPPLPPDDELMDMLINEDGLDRNDESLDNLSVDGKDTGVSAKDDAIDSVLLSPHFNLDGIVGGSTLPQMDSKDVEDLFKGVLSPHNEDSNDFNAILGPSTSAMSTKTSMQIPPPPLTSPLAPPSTQNLMPASSVPLPQLIHSKQATPENTPNTPIMESTFNMPPPSPFPVGMNDNSSSQYSPQISEPQSPWPSEPDTEMTSQGQKNLLKWESDEALGSMATISPVLYANQNHPNLKSEYPLWSDRIKQISKLWRQLPTDQRQPFLQKARENRAANRIQKAQSETQRSGKEIRSITVPNVTGIRDVEHERQWKHLQAARQQQQVQQQQVLQEHRQAILKVQPPVGPVSPGDPSRSSLIHNIPQSPSRLVPDYCSTSEPSPQIVSIPHSQDIQMQPSIQRLPAQGSFTMAMNRPQVQSPSGPSPLSPVIQVSRVRPPIDPNKLPVSATGCKPMQYDPYSHPPNTPRPQIQMTLQANVRPGTPQQRSPFSPSSPGTSHPNQSMTQSSNETFHTPPSTPRPHSNDPYNQTPMPSSPYGQPRTPVSVASPFSPTHSMIPQSQQCVQSNDSYSMQTANQRPQQSFSTDYHSNQMDSSQNNELYTNIGQRIGQRTPDSYNPNMSSPNTDPYARPVPTPQPSHSPQSEPFQKMSPNVIQPDIYSRQPMTPRPQQPIQRSQFDDIYAQQVPTPRMVQQSDIYSHPPGTPRPGFQSQPPQQQSQQQQQQQSPQQLPQHDPYAYQPGTPRPVVNPRTPSLQTIRQPLIIRPPPTSPVDPYARQPGTPMPPPLHDPYAKAPGTPMPMNSNDRTHEGNDPQLLSRQHLRDLLQRQQVRRQQGNDPSVPSTRLWTGIYHIFISFVKNAELNYKSLNQQ